MATLKNLLSSINSWNQISTSPSYWTVRDEIIQVEPKTSNLGDRIQNAWQRSQDLSVVFDKMYTAITSVKKETLIKSLVNPNTASQWEPALKKLKENITLHKNKYCNTTGFVSTLYRSIITGCSSLPRNVESKAKKAIKEIDDLVHKRVVPKHFTPKHTTLTSQKKVASKPQPTISPQTSVAHQKKPQKTGEVDSDFHSYSLPRDKDLRPIVIDQIEKAKKSITIFMYSFTDEQMMQALEKRAQNGVSVKILCEKDTFINAKRKIDKSVAIQVLEPKGLMHLKILVIDTHSVLFGSTNLTTEGMTKDNNIITLIKSDKLAKMVLNRAQNYHDEKSGNGKFELSQGRKVDFIFLPNGNADKTLISHINTAKKSLRIAMYTWTHKEIAETVIKKHQEGVKVTAIIDGGQGGIKGTGHKVTEMLQKAGIEVILSKANQFKRQHLKYVDIDKKIVIHGSANWTKKAFRENMDCLAVLTDLTKSDHNNFDSIWNDLIEAVNKKKKE